jgi:hypothetical protein
MTKCVYNCRLRGKTSSMKPRMMGGVSEVVQQRHLVKQVAASEVMFLGCF